MKSSFKGMGVGKKMMFTTNSDDETTNKESGGGLHLLVRKRWHIYEQALITVIL